MVKNQREPKKKITFESSSDEEETSSNSESDSDQKVDPKPAVDPVTPATVKRPTEEKPSDSQTSKKKSKNHVELETSTEKQTVIAFDPKMHFSGKLVCGNADDRIQKMGDEMFGDGITEDAEEWKRMKFEEADAYIRHVAVKTRQSMFVIEKLRSARKRR